MNRMTLASVLLMTLALSLLALGIYRAVTAAHSQPAVACVTLKDQERILSITLDAIDTAFKHHVENLFLVWLKDYSPEPKRATLGMANGISAHQRAYANARQWKPTVCP